jgi:hypothetical protein
MTTYHKKASSILGNWHNICLLVFLSITIFDFMIFPVFYEYLNYQLTPEKMITVALQIPTPANQLVALQMLSKEHVWQPLTLQQNGLFYMAFGAILGIGAWKRTTKDGEDSPPPSAPPTPEVDKK